VVKYGLALAAIGISMVSLKFFTAPYVWIGLIWFIVVAYYVFTARRDSSLKVLWFNIGFTILVLTAFEGYLWLNQGVNTQPKIQGIHPKKYYLPHELLGYAPRKDIEIRVSKYSSQGELTYDVKCTVDEHGLRISPPIKNSTLAGSVLFFGGSFTFGIGVNDEEVTAYRVGIMSDGRYRTYNFGFDGYGPHQMLAALERGPVEEIVEESNTSKIAIYQSLFDHVQRSAGLAYWDFHGPRYVMQQPGEVRFAGHFDDQNILMGKIIKQFHKSLMYKKLFGFRSSKRAINERDIDLFLGIISTSNKQFKELYPHGEFHVIFWNNKGSEDCERVVNGLKNIGIPVHLISQILPDYETNKHLYHIPEDNHPTARAHEIIARYILNNILEDNGTKHEI